MNKAVYIEDIKAIEALRNGVPNRYAVETLGCNQKEIEDVFLDHLLYTKNTFANNSSHKGLTVAGEFGTGKSHLLEFLKHMAIKDNFVCSKIVISKETPL